MKYSKLLAAVLIGVLMGAEAAAQDTTGDDSDVRRMSEEERRASARLVAEEQRRLADEQRAIARQAADEERRLGDEQRQIARQAANEERRVADEQRRLAREREVLDVEAEMRAAEARMEEAARRIAELSSRQLPNFRGESWAFELSDRPMLGITIDGEDRDGPVEGVVIRGVSPGGAAFDAGLRAGDTITAINKESMSADNSAAANRKLLEFMAGVESGDKLDVEYLRDGKAATVSLQPQPGSAHSFVFAAPRAPRAPRAARAPRPTFVPAVPGAPEFSFWRNDGAWADMEMVTLTADLGRYFGADKGLLVVRAPADEKLKLRDGDVIRSIDGREPESISHAVRILASYQPGETMKLEIMRDKRRQTLTIEIPENLQGELHSELPASPAMVEVLRHRVVRD